MNKHPRPRLEGLHHVTALTADPARCAAFYRDVLGLRRLPPALAFGEPGEVFAFGDRLASPGSIISFALAPPGGRPGAGTIARVGWRVADAGGLQFWRRRLAAAGIVTALLRPSGRDSLPVVRFSDPDGLRHELRLDASGDEPLVGVAEDIPPRFALRGLDGVDAYCRDPVATTDLLAGRLDFAADGPRALRLNGSARQASYRLERAPRSRARAGAGMVDHVAWSCGHGDERIWRQRVIGLGVRVSAVDDRRYYRSVRFREPSGVLFEIASSGPAALAA